MSGVNDVVANAIAKEGRTATAFCAFGRGLEVYSQSAGGFVAFVRVPGGVVTAGEPVTQVTELGELTSHFVEWVSDSESRVSFFATEGRLLETFRLGRWLIGQQPVWDPRKWREHIATHRSLREQLRRSRAKGVRVHLLAPEQAQSDEWRKPFEALINRWHATRSMPPMGFIVDIDLSAGAAWRRTYVAVRGHQLVGLLSMVPVPARNGWLLEHLLRDPDAPNGTLELLVHHAMTDMGNESVPWATLGLAPLYGPVRPLFKVIRAVSKPLFNFEGLSSFKQKLRPIWWEPIYVAWPEGRDNGWRALLDGLRAFAGQSFLRFGIRTFTRGPESLLRFLEFMLVPWTVMLALLSTSPWFPNSVVHGAWVCFDVLLLLAFGWLRRFSGLTGAAARKRAAVLSSALAVAVSLDVVVTIAQVFFWNAGLKPSVSEWVLLVLGCLAPAITAPILWGASRRLRILAMSHPKCPQL